MSFIGQSSLLGFDQLSGFFLYFCLQKYIILVNGFNFRNNFRVIHFFRWTQMDKRKHKF